MVGSGASAFTALAALASLAEEPGTRAVCVLRRGVSGSTYGGGTARYLPIVAFWAVAVIDDRRARPFRQQLRWRPARSASEPS